MKKTKKIRFIQITVILTINILLLVILDVIGDFFNLKKLQIEDSKDIMENIVFYSFFFILIAPVLEELLYRLPLKKNRYVIFSLLISVVYILIFNILIVKIALIIYLLSIIYLIFSKNEVPKVFIILSILVFTISHLGNYNVAEIKSLNFFSLLFLLLPQMILGIINSLIRINISFKYSLLYHALYNMSIITLAIIYN